MKKGGGHNLDYLNYYGMKQKYLRTETLISHCVSKIPSLQNNTLHVTMITLIIILLLLKIIKAPCKIIQTSSQAPIMTLELEILFIFPTEVDL